MRDKKLPPQVGRELKVSELIEGEIVALYRRDRDHLVTLRAAKVMPSFVLFMHPHTGVFFQGKRVGEKLEKITDDSGAQLTMHQWRDPATPANGAYSHLSAIT